DGLTNRGWDWWDNQFGIFVLDPSLTRPSLPDQPDDGRNGARPLSCARTNGVASLKATDRTCRSPAHARRRRDIPGRASMTKADDGAPRDVSRRSLFKQVGAVGAATMAATSFAPGVAVAQERSAQMHGASDSPAAVPLEALETLTAAEADTL